MKSAQYLLVGLDEKVTWDNGQIRFLPPGNDALCIFDVATCPNDPELIATVPLPNSLFGPPCNLAVTPDNRLALIADSVRWLPDGDGWQAAPGHDLHVIDLSVRPPRLAQTLCIGAQPSGLAINRAGTLALAANKAGASVSVLRIHEGCVSVIDEVFIGSAVVAVSFTPDGRRALLVKTDLHRLGLLHIDGETVHYDTSEDITTGLVPFNVVISPDGKLALTVDMGHPNASDGHADTISVVDLCSTPPRVIDKVVIEDGPEGIAMSPDGRYAAVAVVRGSNSNAWFRHPTGRVVLLRIDGVRVTRSDVIDVGALPEGLAFSPDGRFLYVGNFLDATLQILAVHDGKLIDDGRRIRLAGHPASMRMQAA